MNIEEIGLRKFVFSHLTLTQILKIFKISLNSQFRLRTLKNMKKFDLNETSTRERDKKVRLKC